MFNRVGNAPRVLQQPRQFDGTVKVGKRNIDENPEPPSGFNIHSIPAVLLFKGGGVVETFVGVQPKERYE